MPERLLLAAHWARRALEVLVFAVAAGALVVRFGRTSTPGDPAARAAVARCVHALGYPLGRLFGRLLERELVSESYGLTMCLRVVATAVAALAARGFSGVLEAFALVAADMRMVLTARGLGPGGEAGLPER